MDYPGPAGCRVNSFKHLGCLGKIRANPRGLGEGAFERGPVYECRRALVQARACVDMHTPFFSIQRIFGATKGSKSGERGRRERETGIRERGDGRGRGGNWKWPKGKKKSSIPLFSLPPPSLVLNA